MVLPEAAMRASMAARWGAAKMSGTATGYRGPRLRWHAAAYYSQPARGDLSRSANAALACCSSLLVLFFFRPSRSRVLNRVVYRTGTLRNEPLLLLWPWWSYTSSWKTSSWRRSRHLLIGGARDRDVISIWALVGWFVPHQATRSDPIKCVRLLGSKLDARRFFSPEQSLGYTRNGFQAYRVRLQYGIPSEMCRTWFHSEYLLPNQVRLCPQLAWLHLA